ncbi:MAG TPA: CBS domain-containing protein [Bryobacteraceae bacterium]|nr:CBS domain-containing protein [Bryobacteraceae bacterium]HOL70660.1 CBS domain-containing protein [Bryobacteraceae bacterium]HOQ44037.1 CBS domain-containing protein [Bryobacteraceae bacterium]HPQ16560.1 CBS domain-containing protein [Bryobacteraceae bacterium]HPU70355.1 CBS domain-containing protein [Bryobacteraceae bacterium]
MADRVRSILANKGSAIWSVTPESTVYEALMLMAEKDVGALPVVSEGKLAGIFSERDYARKVALMGRSSKEMRVSEIMTGEVITITPDHSIDECMRIVTEHRIRHLPVVEGDRLVGIVSIGDLVNAIISAQAATIEHLSNYITGNYPS